MTVTNWPWHNGEWLVWDRWWIKQFEFAITVLVMCGYVLTTPGDCWFRYLSPAAPLQSYSQRVPPPVRLSYFKNQSWNKKKSDELWVPFIFLFTDTNIYQYQIKYTAWSLDYLYCAVQIVNTFYPTHTTPNLI